MKRIALLLCAVLASCEPPRTSFKVVEKFDLTDRCSIYIVRAGAYHLYVVNSTNGVAVCR